MPSSNRPIARAGLALGLLLLLLAAVLGGRAALLPSHQREVPALAPLHLDTRQLAEHLAAGIRLRTVSVDGQPDTSAAEFLRLHELLERSFPNAHRVMRRETVNGFSLLYTWPGSDPSARPWVLLAHQDVVPVAPETEARWQHPPFGGEIAQGHVWGRGAWDNKGNLFAIMEAVERLAADGFRPRATIHLVFGHDEEMGDLAGQRGAGAVARLLRERGVRASFVLDEGLVVTQGVMTGLPAPVALVGVAEKGFMTVSMSARGLAGHSSQPPARTAVGTLAAALARLDARPMPAAIDGVARSTLDTLAPEFEGLNRVALANLWLFGPLVEQQLQHTPAGLAMLRSTVAPTVLRAGDKVSVLPAQADAQLNIRIKPGDTPQSVMSHLHRSLDGLEVTLRQHEPSWPASPVSPSGHEGYRRIEAAIREVFPGTRVAPGLMVGATDARHFAGIAEAVYRFSPVRAQPQDLARFHGIDERMSLDNLAEMVRFYHRLLSAPAVPS